MRMLKKLAQAGVVAVAVTSLAACNGVGSGGAGGPVRVMVPNSPGGGYDTTARIAAQTMEDEKVHEDVSVYNLEGAGGTTGLAKLVGSQGKKGELMLMGLGVVGAVYTQQSEKTLADTTPIARLISEPDTIVVPAKSKYKTLDQLVQDWKKDPDNFAVGGGSSPGGPDHIAAHQTADAVEIEPTDVRYVVYDGGGPLLAGLLSGEVKFGVTGVGEIQDQVEAGQLRVLGVTSAERVPGFDAPTLMEQGVDLEFTNWRGLVAPPGIDDKEQERLIGLVEEMHGTQAWKDAMAENGWTDAFLTGDEFGTYLKEQDAEVQSVLSDLGLV